MKDQLPHISVGQIIPDPFLTSGRSKSIEHKDRLRSDFSENINSENNQKFMKNEENMS